MRTLGNMNNFYFNSQFLRVLIFITVSGLLSFGYFLQYAKGLEPCPLCITQRFFFFLVAGLSIISFLHNPNKIFTRFYSLIGIIFSISGAGFAIRQLYLQSLPIDQIPACGPSIGYIFNNFSVTEALGILLRGDGNCAEVVWSFLGLSIPAWSLAAFLFISFLWTLQLITNKS